MNGVFVFVRRSRCGICMTSIKCVMCVTLAPWCIDFAERRREGGGGGRGSVSSSFFFHVTDCSRASVVGGVGCVGGN